MAKVKVGKIVGISGCGPFPSMFSVAIKQARTGQVFTVNVQNTQPWHPIGEVADVERAKRSLPTGQFTGARISLIGVKVAFVEEADELGFVGSVIHYDAYKRLKAEIAEHGQADPDEVEGAGQW